MSRTYLIFFTVLEIRSKVLIYRTSTDLLHCLQTQNLSTAKDFIHRSVLTVHFLTQQAINFKTGSHICHPETCFVRTTLLDFRRQRSFDLLFCEQRKKKVLWTLKSNSGFFLSIPYCALFQLLVLSHAGICSLFGGFLTSLLGVPGAKRGDPFH
jgi:hypothetical protein